MHLTAEQERLWLLQQLRPTSSAYQLMSALWIDGSLDLDAWQTTLRKIRQRHPLLRTFFPTHDGRPRPTLEERSELAFSVLDPSDLPAAGREATVQEILSAESRRPFDLESQPPIRAGAIRLEADRHVVWLCAHRILIDEGALGPFYRELEAFYIQAQDEQDAPISHLTLPMGDRDPEPSHENVAFWRARLAGLEDLYLPTDLPRPAVQRHRGDHCDAVWPTPGIEALRKLARRHDASLFAVILAAFGTVLRRASGQRELAIGCTRPGSESGGPIVHRVEPGTPRLGDLIERAHRSLQEAEAHREPFASLIQHLPIARDLSRHPIFQASFGLQGAPAAPDLPDLEIRPLDLPSTPIVDLALTVTASEDSWRVRMSYDADLFDATTIARLLDQLRSTLAATLADADLRSPDLSVANRAGCAQILREWNDTEISRDPRTTLHERFFQQVQHSPTRTALIWGEDETTYQQLSDEVRHLATILRSRGVGSEVPVGICLDRTPKLIVALLAVLDAGGLYVPLDPTYPQDRLEMILADSEARWVITDSRHADHLPDDGPSHLLIDRDLAPASANVSGSSASTANNLAYLIYTSGSTGRPKGVAIEHRSAVTLLDWASGHYRSEDLEGVLFSTSICFDLSVFEIFLTLTRGGTLILADHALHLTRLPVASRVTLLNTVPSAADGLLRLGPLPPALRTINLAGEPLTTELADRLYGQDPVERVFDLYGPSEDTTYSTFACRQPGGTATIGRPIGDTESYLLDPTLRPVPHGSLGELCLSGRGLARGYLRRPARTASGFVPHPLTETPGERIYRTGDLARYLADGRLALAGRRDHQVKVRGFRVELGEIESALVEHPRVREAVVVKAAEELGSRLVAYAVPSSNEAPSEAELRDNLNRQLPDFMVPSAIVLLEDLPRTPNGKIDRAALPDPDPEASRLRDEPSELELDLQWIWEEVLDKTVEIGDDFFRLGGDSFQALHLLALIHEELDVELPLVAVFQAPSLQQMAARIEAISEAE